MKLCKKWELNSASDLPIPLCIPKGKKKPGDKELLELDRALFGEDPAQLNAVSVLKSPGVCPSLQNNPQRGEKPACKICDSATVCPGFLTRFKEVNKQNGMDYLELRVDLKATDEDITSEIKGELYFYRQFIFKGKSRKRDNEYDPWDIWDYCEIWEKKPLQLAKEIYLKNGGNPNEDLNPAYNQKVKPIYERILRAYNNAKRMINDIDIKA